MIVNSSCSIVIRAYNEAQHIGRLLDGISRQTVGDKEIILVDSGSSDETTTIAGRYPVKIMHIRPEEFSFGRSLNMGIAAARHEFVVIASAHVYPVYPDWLERLLEPLSDPQVGLAYGKQRGDETTRFSEQQVFSRWYQDSSTNRQMHPFCNNANAAIRRKLWERHPYDENLTGLEDLAWARWVMDQGFAVAYAAEAEIVHLHNETPGGIYNRYRREAMAYKRIFPTERFSFADFLRLLIGNILSDFQHAAHCRCLRKNIIDIIGYRWMQFWGTYQGYRHPGPVTEHLRKTFYYPNRVGPVKQNPVRDVEPIRYRDSP